MNEETSRLKRLYEVKLPSFFLPDGSLEETARMKYSTIMNNPRTFDNVLLFLHYIGHQGIGIKERLVDALSARDVYVRLKQEDIEQVPPELREAVSRFLHLSPYYRAWFGSEMYLLARDILFDSHEVVEGVSNLWEVTAQLIRSFYQLNLPMRTNLWNVLRHVKSAPRFDDLINHTEFYVTTDNKGNQIGHYRSGSVLDKLKGYRNRAVHLLGPQYESIIRDAGSISKVKIYDHVGNSFISIDVQTPEELANLAEDSYIHFLKGHEIVDTGMKRFLGL